MSANLALNLKSSTERFGDRVAQMLEGTVFLRRFQMIRHWFHVKSNEQSANEPEHHECQERQRKCQPAEPEYPGAAA